MKILGQREIDILPMSLVNSIPSHVQISSVIQFFGRVIVHSVGKGKMSI